MDARVRRPQPKQSRLGQPRLCAHAPWVEEVVDFERLKNYDGDFFINAYNLTRNEMEIFHKEQITADHFRAALAFPFIYPPYELNGNFYIEGSAIDPMNFEDCEHMGPRSGTPFWYLT